MTDQNEVPWLIQRGEQRYQCPDEATLRAWYQSGQVLRTDLVFHPSLHDWRRVDEVVIAPQPSARGRKHRIVWVGIAAVALIGVTVTAFVRLHQVRRPSSAAAPARSAALLRVAAIQTFVHESDDGPECTAPMTLENSGRVPIWHLAVTATWPEGFSTTATVDLGAGRQMQVPLRARVPRALLPRSDRAPVISTAEAYAAWNDYLAERNKTLRSLCVEPALAFAANGTHVPFTVAPRQEQDQLIDAQDAKVIREFEEQHFGGKRPH